MTYPERPDSLNDSRDHRHDAQAAGAWDTEDLDAPTWHEAEADKEWN